MSRTLRTALTTEANVLTDVRIYITLPAVGEHKFHLTGKVIIDARTLSTGLFYLIYLFNHIENNNLRAFFIELCVTRLRA